ncbi:MAG: hypothetical protein AAF743_07580, partial [Planctomycetota bacterium]
AAAQEIEYKYRADLDALKFNVRELEAKADAMEAWVAQFENADPVTVPDAELNKYANAYNDALRKAGFAADSVKKLPGDHPLVQEQIKKFQDAATRIDATQAVFAKIFEAKQAGTDTTQFGDIEADLKKLNEITDGYGNWQELFWNRPAFATQLLTDHPNAVAEYNRIAQAYAPLLKSDTAEAKQLNNRLAYVANRLNELQQARVQYLPFNLEKATEALDAAQQLINTGINEKKPAFFGEDGGVNQQLGMAEVRIALIAAIEPGRERAYQQRYENLTAQSSQAATMLRESIIANNRGPDDRYRGPDRDAILAKVRAAYLAEYPDDTILAIRIPGENWERITKWEWFHDAFYKVDYSKLQASVIIQTSPTEATYYPVNLRVDHLKNDEFAAYPWSKEDAPVRWTMLIENVK